MRNKNRAIKNSLHIQDKHQMGHGARKQGTTHGNLTVLFTGRVEKLRATQ